MFGNGCFFRFIEIEQVRLFIHLLRLSKRRGVSETIHLPEVPAGNLGYEADILIRRHLSPEVHMIFAEGEQDVDTGDEKAVSLEFEAIAALDCLDSPCRPGLCSLGVLADNAELAVEKPDPPAERKDGITRGGVIAGDQIWSFSACDLDTFRVYVVMPVPAFRENYVTFDSLPLVVRQLPVEHVCPPEPLLVEIIVHAVAEPCRSEDLRHVTGALLLFLKALEGAWLNHDRIVRKEHLLTDMVGRLHSFVCVCGEDDALSCGLVLQQCGKNHIKWMCGYNEKLSHFIHHQERYFCFRSAIMRSLFT